MTIWADADSLPSPIRELIGRRAGASTVDFPIRAVFVANRTIPLPPGKNLQAIIVGPAAASAKPESDSTARATHAPTQTADEYILEAAILGDILVTRDIPLASKALENNIITLNDRGTFWTAGEVRERLSVRDHLTALRESGLAPILPKIRSFGQKETKMFADALDKAIQSSKAFLT
jgi:uncharacterized protein YaiI (UPF0178 family)